VTCFGGGDLVAFRMYDRPGRLVEGFAKNFAAGAAATPKLRLLAIVAWIGACLVAGVGLLGGGPVAILIYAAFAVQCFVMLRQLGNFGIVAALLFPLLAVVFVAVFLGSLVLVVRGEVRWRAARSASAAPTTSPIVSSNHALLALLDAACWAVWSTICGYLAHRLPPSLLARPPRPAPGRVERFETGCDQGVEGLAARSRLTVPRGLLETAPPSPRPELPAALRDRDPPGRAGPLGDPGARALLLRVEPVVAGLAMLAYALVANVPCIAGPALQPGPLGALLPEGPPGPPRIARTMSSGSPSHDRLLMPGGHRVPIVDLVRSSPLRRARRPCRLGRRLVPALVVVALAAGSVALAVPAGAQTRRPVRPAGAAACARAQRQFARLVNANAKTKPRSPGPDAPERTPPAGRVGLAHRLDARLTTCGHCTRVREPGRGDRGPNPGTLLGEPAPVGQLLARLSAGYTSGTIASSSGGAAARRSSSAAAASSGPNARVVQQHSTAMPLGSSR